MTCDEVEKGARFVALIPSQILFPLRPALLTPPRQKKNLNQLCREDMTTSLRFWNENHCKFGYVPSEHERPLFQNFQLFTCWHACSFKGAEKRFEILIINFIYRYE